MRILAKILNIAMSWFKSDRRRIIGAIFIPLFVAIALLAPKTGGSSNNDSATQLPTGSNGQAPSAPSGSPIPVPTAPVTVGPSDEPRKESTIPAPAATVARNYVTTVNSHDARPGKDHEYLDSYRRVKPFVTDELFNQLTTQTDGDRPLGDQAWTKWTQQQATVSVKIDRVVIPDGAPFPTADTVYVGLNFTQRVTPHAQGSGEPTDIPGTLRLVATKQQNGNWLVSQLLNV